MTWSAGISGRLDDGSLFDRWSIDDGERIQLAVMDLKVTAGDARAGWKVGLTSGRSRDAFGPGIRPFGHILRSRVFASGSELSLAGLTRPELEVELCFQIGRRLEGSRVSRDEAREAVVAVGPSFEIVEDRLDGSKDPGLRLADDLSHWGIVRGDRPQPVPAGFDLDSLVSELSGDGVVLQRVDASGHIDDSFESLVTLARELAKFGRALEPDDVVITGAFARHRVERPGTYSGAFDGLGTVSVVVSAVPSGDNAQA
jgi:2-keto-4-pentenoate hydratase